MHEYQLSNLPNVIIAGIGTDVGKTVASAIVTEALEADYWKPVQSGALDQTDRDTVRSLVSNPKSQFHPESYRLGQPISPHAAARAENIEIVFDNIILPRTHRQIVIELAGGVMSPLTETLHNLDLISMLGFPVIIVSRNYLGSINHTLLTVEACTARGAQIAGIIFDGTPIASTEDFIENYTRLPVIGRIEPEPEITREAVRRYAEQMRDSLINILTPLRV